MSYSCNAVQKWYLLLVILVLFHPSFAQNKRSFLPSKASLTDAAGKDENRIADRKRVNYPVMEAQGMSFQKADELAVVQRYDSIYHWTWDTYSAKWKYYYKDINLVYTTDDIMVNYNRFMWQNNAWMKSTQGTLVLDDNNNVIYQNMYFWREGQWQEDMRYFYTYDAKNNKTSSSRQMKSVDRWIAFNQTLYGYDENNRLISETSQEAWDGGWINSRQTMFYYNDLQDDSLRIYQSWTGDSWYDGSKIIYSYDAQDRLVKEVEQLSIDGHWIDIAQHLYSYDAGDNMSMHLYQDIEGSFITDGYKVIYTYDANHNVIHEKAESWNGSSWRTTSQGSNTYDENNFKISRSYKSYASTGEIISSDSTYNYYKTGYSGIDETLEGDISLFPNPGHGKFTVGGKNNINALEVYSLQGVRIYADFQQSPLIAKEIDLSPASKGIYVVKITSGTKVYSRKIVIR